VSWLIALRVTTSGLLWAATYNTLWGVAWFTFMRQEWRDAFAAVGQPLAWTPRVWFIWMAVTVPLGIALMAYAQGHTRRLFFAVRGTAALFLVFATGMAVWGLHESLPYRVLSLDALVNAISMPLASIVAAASLRPAPTSGSPSPRAAM
jgi:hypothetical protein